MNLKCKWLVHKNLIITQRNQMIVHGIDFDRVHIAIWKKYIQIIAHIQHVLMIKIVVTCKIWA